MYSQRLIKHILLACITSFLRYDIPINRVEAFVPRIDQRKGFSLILQQRNGFLPLFSTSVIGKVPSKTSSKGDDVTTNDSKEHETREDDTTSPPPGQPSVLSNLSIGEELSAYRLITQSSNDSILSCSKSHPFHIERVSSSPDVFILRNFLTLNECHLIMQQAEKQEMNQAETLNGEGQSARRNCRVAWIPSDDEGMVQSLAEAAGCMLLSDDIKKKYSAECENLQLLHYEEGGNFILHHDGNQRLLTVIYYLNGVGGTWFPLAKMEDDNLVGWHLPPENREEALKLADGCIPGRDGLLITGDDLNGSAENKNVVYIKEGDAVAFYNYRMEKMGARVDWNAIHAGLPATGKRGKWIANHWFRVE